MKEILKDIRENQFQKAYLLYGEENYLKIQYRDRLVKALCPQEDAMNTARFSGKGIDIREVMELGDTLPFFSDRRILILEDTGFFKGQCPDLPEYLSQLPEYLCMIFVETDVDKRSRMYKAMKKYGTAAEFPVQDEHTLMRWVLGILKREGRRITQKDMELFLSGTGTDMCNIEKELEKLLCYTMGRQVITGEDIREVCTGQITNRIFEMLRAVSQQQQKKALDLYYDLLALKEPPMRILFLLARQFNMLLQTKELVRLGYDRKGIGEKLGVQGFAARNYMAFAEKYSADRLRKAVEDCAAAEEEVKTGRLGDVMSVELLLIRYSSPENKKDSH